MTTATEFYVGSVARLSVNIQVSSTDTDPTALSLLVRAPSGTVTTYTYPTHIQKTDVGDYYYDLAITADGTWRWRWVGTGTAAGADEGSFFVKSQTVTA